MVSVAPAKRASRSASDVLKVKVPPSMSVFPDASADKVGIKIAAPTSDLHVAGTMKVTSTVDLDGGAFTWNEAGADLDLRLESENLENMLVVDGSADKIGIGTAGPADARLEINQAVTDAAIACLSLDQDDEDQEFIFFEGTSASDQTKSITTETTVGVLTGYIRVNINDTDYWMPFYETS